MKIACITQYNDLMFNLLDNKYQIYKLSANVCMLIVVCSALGGGVKDFVLNLVLPVGHGLAEFPK